MVSFMLRPSPDIRSRKERHVLARAYTAAPAKVGPSAADLLQSRVRRNFFTSSILTPPLPVSRFSLLVSPGTPALFTKVRFVHSSPLPSGLREAQTLQHFHMSRGQEEGFASK